MRTLFFVLLAANLAVLGWTLLTPAAPPLWASPPPDVPRLVLASEAASAAGVAMHGGETNASAACRSIGPFTDEQEAARAAAAFHEGGYVSTQRTEEARVSEGFWVSLPAQRNAADETRTLARLARAGITDARVMTDTGSRRISVGLFSEHDRAERRATEARRLGYVPDVTERLHIGTTWWIDLQLRTPAEIAEAESFNQSGSSALEMKPCPASQPVTAAGEAAGVAAVESP